MNERMERKCNSWIRSSLCGRCSAGYLLTSERACRTTNVSEFLDMHLSSSMYRFRRRRRRKRGVAVRCTTNVVQWIRKTTVRKTLKHNRVKREASDRRVNEIEKTRVELIRVSSYIVDTLWVHRRRVIGASPTRLVDKPIINAVDFLSSRSSTGRSTD